jgi:hypothetical protein
MGGETLTFATVDTTIAKHARLRNSVLGVFRAWHQVFSLAKTTENCTDTILPENVFIGIHEQTTTAFVNTAKGIRSSTIPLGH